MVVVMLAVTAPLSMSLGAVGGPLALGHVQVSSNVAAAVTPLPCQPSCNPQMANPPASCSTNHGFLPNLYNGITCDANGAPQIKSAQDVLVILANAIQIGIALAGALAVIFIIVGGILYTTSAGDSKRVSQAKGTITYAIAGLILCLAAYAIVQFISTGF